MEVQEKNSNLSATDELSVAEDNLSNDMQALAYLQEELTGTKGKWIDISFIKNGLETLLKSMLYNQENIRNALKRLENR